MDKCSAGLVSLGVEAIEDVKEVSESDLVENGIKTVHARKLLREIRAREANQAEGGEAAAAEEDEAEVAGAAARRRGGR